MASAGGLQPKTRLSWRDDALTDLPDDLPRCLLDDRQRHQTFIVGRFDLLFVRAHFYPEAEDGLLTGNRVAEVCLLFGVRRSRVPQGIRPSTVPKGYGAAVWPYVRIGQCDI